MAEEDATSKPLHAEERLKALEAHRRRHDREIDELGGRVTRGDRDLDRLEGAFASLESLRPRVDRLERPDWLNGELAGIGIRLTDLERARSLALRKLEELGAWTYPTDPNLMDERLRGEAAELKGRATAVLDHGEAPFDGEVAAALYHVGSVLTRGVLGLMAAILESKPPAVPISGELPEKIEVAIAGPEPHVPR